MWSVFRFSLSDGGERAYRDALEILRGAGFRRAPDPVARCEPGAAFPAVVVGDVRRSPAEVTRIIFVTLDEAGLRPVGVSGCRAAERPSPERAART
jgi:hypothetical protein